MMSASVASFINGVCAGHEGGGTGPVKPS
jgi:hypothetical protein